MDSDVEAWRSWLLAAGRPRSTVHLRTYQVTRWFCESHCEPDTTRTAGLLDWLAAKDWSPETRRSYRAALQGFFRWEVQRGRLRDDPAAALPAVRVPPAMPRPAPERVFSEALSAGDERVRLMVLLAGRVGLRRGEIAALHANALQPDLLGWSLLVTGKGGRVRTVPVVDEVAAAIRHRILQVGGGGWLFPGRVGGHLSAHRVGDLVRDALPGAWTCHSLRHRFATAVYAGSGGDLLATQRLLGHAKPETTARYVGLSDARLRAAVGAA